MIAVETEAVIAGLTLAEASMLLMTNSEHPEKINYFTNLIPNEPRKLYLTTKDSYIWAKVAAMIVEIRYKKELALDIDEIAKQASGIVADHADFILNHYKSPFSDANVFNAVYSDIVREMIIKLTGEDIPYRVILEEVIYEYNHLTDSDYIQDPVSIAVAGMAIVALGLLPYGWTITTTKGDVKKTEIKALLWKYVKEMESDGRIKKLDINLEKTIWALRVLEVMCLGIPVEIEQILTKLRRQ